MSWSWVWWVAVAIVVLDALRLRVRAAGLRSLPDAADDHEPAPGVVWLTAPGVDPTPPIRHAAAAHMAKEALHALDLVPRDLPAERALDLLRRVDPKGYRDRRTATGATAGQALAFDEDVAARSEVSGGAEVDPVSLERAARILKLHAVAATDVVVADGLRAGCEDLDRRLAVWRGRFGTMWVARAVLPLLGYAFLAAGVALYPIAGIVALAAWSALPALALAGSPLRPRDLWWRWALRGLVEPVAHLRSLAGRWRAPAGADGRVDVDSLRPVYAQLLAAGTAPFFEERRPTCPLCASEDLVVHVRAPDLLQGKPGRFTLERCRGCGVIFQNPRLSVAGLDFYYRDFYDGLGGEQVGLVFGAGSRAYTQRAELLRGHAEPRRWLDIGAGHGHFCMVAADTWPQTCFDGLDMSEAIGEAERRGWITKGYRGMFPELAPELVGRYDVVSMHHYLEHTRAPLEELDAAAAVVAPGGHVVIELPDPESGFGRLLGRYWLPWFQPQHQYLLTLGWVCEALEARGLHVVERQRAVAHHPVDLTAGTYLLLNRVARPTGTPWRARRPLAVVWRWSAFALAVPVFVAAVVADLALELVARPGWRSNAFRVLARKPEGATG